MGRLTTHVLDTAAGVPGRDIAIEVFRLDGDQRRRLSTAVTNADGRCDAPLLDGEAFSSGVYELVFDAGGYFATRHAAAAPEPRFLDQVVIRFGVADPDQHYHVPLLISPYSYSTYRGS